uniref:Uncharacterized protein n=1 Tax=Echeneis naucrates TaxID=173247 RepID=A0A665V3V3_ECHNA
MNSGVKLTFGSGTKLTVVSSADYEPLYYELESNETKACLATGFSKHDAAKNKSVFRNEEAARPSKKSWDGSLEDALYSSVALISNSAEKCEEDSRPTKPCGDFLEKDPTVNAVSLTILGLRLLFIKTIVFNVLITLRFWMSQ